MPRLPLPFSQRPVSEWINDLQKANNAEERLKALQAIGSMAAPPEITKWSAQSLHDSDSTVRAFAATLLGRVGLPASPDAEAQLVSMLSDSDPDVRFEASRALIRGKSSRVGQTVAVLLSLLDEPETNPLMFATVINLLTEIDLSNDFAEHEILQRLLRSIEHERGEVREAIAMAFAKWPSIIRGCSGRLVPLLDDVEPVVREKIAEAFGKSGVADDSVIAALREACSDEDAEVAHVAAEALKLLGRQS